MINEPYVDICLGVLGESSAEEILSALLSELGFTGFAEDETGFHCYIPRDRYVDSIRTELRQLIASPGETGATIRSETEIAARNWNEEWEQTITPLQVSENIIIAPSWHPFDARPGQLVVTIDPKMSFGTGYHESTRLMIRLIENHLRPAARVLDVGTGTGVLAIVAVKLGASSAIAIDIDEWTAVNGKENVERNALTGFVAIRHGSLDVVPETGFGMVLANIQRNVILEMLTELLLKIAPDGILLLSGLMLEDRPTIEEALAQNGFAAIDVIRENEWIGIAAHAHRVA
ncbi:MAG: 50S ribosomal protein L11 methyltransferase [Ignavibacteriales bacterium]|nr:50S ribosomal protein L11 methyltransferase [Ignavibacteriales bacterium]